jgi:hypothetical protein
MLGHSIFYQHERSILLVSLPEEVNTSSGKETTTSCISTVYDSSQYVGV